MCDFEAEKRALQTMFFSQQEVDGQLRECWDVDYLALLNLDTAKATNVISILRSLLAGNESAAVEKDTLLLLQAGNWRVHLIACGALLCGCKTPSILTALWSTLCRKSWVSPQICATSYLVDPTFAARARDFLALPSIDAKAIVAVARLAEVGHKITPDTDQQSRIADATTQDPHGSDEIAVRWADRARELFAI
jgi:hypothetical protein